MVSFLLFIDPSIASAQGPDLSDPSVAIDNLFVFVCAVFVILMQVGFAMLETGLTRAKNAAHLMLKNVLDFIVGATGFALLGYHLAFSGAAFFGFRWLWGAGSDPAPFAPNLSMPVHFLFHMAFAAATATIVSGAVAERIQFRAYFVYSGLLSAFMYPVVVGWVWNPSGWLAEAGFVDLAGSTVVHTVGGTAALIGAIVLGPRIGRFTADGASTPIDGHSVPTAINGVLILLVCWFSFNAGSLLSVNTQLGAVGAVTALGAAFGGLGGIVTSWARVKLPDVALIGNGLLGGLVSITAGAASFNAIGAMLVGFAGGMIAANGALLLERFRIDDPVGAVPVHLMAGVWGTIAVGIFSDPAMGANGDGPAGLVHGGSRLLLSQVIGTLSVVCFVAIASTILFVGLRSVGWLRVSRAEEMLGLDVAEHASVAYANDTVDYGDSIAAEAAEWLTERTAEVVDD
jgi:Amt family ammonium transporter